MLVFVRAESLELPAWTYSGLEGLGRSSRSRALPMRRTSGGRAAMSASDVRKFTMQALRANLPPMTAFER
jgi:hypothetical protein